MKIPVLFCDTKSSYKKFDQFDVYDKNRNALHLPDQKPSIFHPPCRMFSRMRKFSTAPACEMMFAYWSMAYVRNHYGIVEHPRSSTLWQKMEVGTPLKPDRYGGYIISINLNWFGFPCEKKTCLYIVGLPYGKLPALPLSFVPITHTISNSRSNNKTEIKKSLRAQTPTELIFWLENVINLINLHNGSSHQPPRSRI